MSRFSTGFRNSYWLINFAFILLFFGFVLPHGVGFFKSTNWPSSDLPRISLMLFNVVATFVVLTRPGRVSFRNIFDSAPVIQSILLFICVFLIFKSIGNGGWSIAWAVGDCVQIWLAAFLAITLCENEYQWARLMQMVSLLFFTVAILAWIEWVGQKRLFTVRNLWSPDMLQSALDLKRIYFLSIGPYPNNHYLGLVLLATSGPLFMSRYRLPASILFAGGILSTGFVAGFIAAGVSLSLVGLIKRDRTVFLVLLFYLLGLAFILTDGGVKKIQANQAYSHVFSNNSNRGSVQSRFEASEESLFLTWERAPLSGFGAGALVDARVSMQTGFHPPSADVGGAFRLAIEYGFLVFSLVIGSLGISAWRGIHSRDAKCQGAAISIISFLIAICSSQILQSMPIILILCGFIENRIKYLNNTKKL